MKQLDGSALSLQLLISLQRWGSVPMLALLCFALGAGSWVWLSACPDKSAAGLHETLLQRHAELRSARRAGSENPAEVDGKVGDETYAQKLGDGAQVEQYVSMLFELAQHSEIQLDTGEYKWQTERSLGLDRYQIRLPIKGRYEQIRDFCERTLIALPFASIDQLSLKREAVTDDSVSATLQLTLHLRPQATLPTSAIKGARP